MVSCSYDVGVIVVSCSYDVCVIVVSCSYDVGVFEVSCSYDVGPDCASFLQVPTLSDVVYT